MITSSDKEFKATKQIMLGNAILNPDFKELADFIDQTFKVKTINIIYDINKYLNIPRLNICFESEQEKKLFNDETGFNFDTQKQKLLADKFNQTLNDKKKTRKKGFFDFLLKTEKSEYKTENTWIFYSAFEPIARDEANQSIPTKEIAKLKKELGNKDLWEISKGFAIPTFFLYTDDQVRQYENSEIRKLWADKYFDLLEPFNEFGYFKQDEFNVYLDSKENFDNNYESNWYYYYK